VPPDVREAAPVPADWDAWVEELAAADPDRLRSAPEILRDGEHGELTPALLAELSALEPAALTADQQVALAVATDRALAHFTARKLAAVSAFAGPIPRDDVAPGANRFAFAWTDLAAALKVGEGSARKLVSTAAGFRRLPGTFAALLAGRISYPKALRILEATAGLSDDAARAVEDLVLPRAGSRTYAAHSDAVARAVVKVDPAGWKKRREERLADVALVRLVEGDGVASILARNVDAVEADVLWTAADTYARHAKADGDPRNLDALRVAFLVDAAKAYLAGAPLVGAPRGEATPPRGGCSTRPRVTPQPRVTPCATPSRHGMPATPASRHGMPATPATPPSRHGMPAVVNVIVPLAAAVGASDEPGVLVGTGEPLPADAVADLLDQEVKVRFALTDAGGNLVGISTKLHDPPTLMRVFIALRDLTLRVPGGSSTPVAGQDLDHLDPAGPTAPSNLHAPSRGWHRAKTYGHWTVAGNANGTITWTSSRTGRTYTTQPYDYRGGP
jgi:hypothetical protein